MAIDDFEILYTVSEVASYCRVSESTVREWILTRKLEAHKMGKSWRISSLKLRMFMEETVSNG